MSSTDILRFLRDPRDFAEDSIDADLWEASLYDIASPRAEATGQPLREAQIQAWKGLARARVGLILGPPGTGKTHALAWMAAAYLEARRAKGLPCRIYVTAFTRNAIVNLLEAIAKRGALLPERPRVVFAGRSPVDQLSDGVEGVDTGDLEGLLDTDYIVVGMTVWGLNKYLGARDVVTDDIFHLVCIDEASQMVLSHGLMALAGLEKSGRVIVAGDNKQLPPIREEYEHRIDGRRLGSSLYTFLQAANVPEYPLDETFRLNEPLTRYPRSRFYEERYRSATPDRRLNLIPDWENGLEDWERVALDPEYPICVLVHDGPPSGTSNAFEAAIVARLSDALLKRLPPPASGNRDDLWEHGLAVISPHRAQNALIRRLLAQTPHGDNSVVETVDRIQGRERDAILVSYAVADPEFALAEAEFIFSPERLNVTITRARSKLIVLLSRRLLEVVPSDAETVDKAQGLREFVNDAELASSIQLRAPDHSLCNVDMRLVRFTQDQLLPKLEPRSSTPVTDLPEPTENDLRILQEIRTRAAANHKWGDVRDFDIANAMRVKPATIFPTLRLLQRHGLIALDPRPGNPNFFSITPIPSKRVLFSLSDQKFSDRVQEVIVASSSSSRGAEYRRVRDAFDWLAEDGTDAFQPALDSLHAEGIVQYERDKRNRLWVSRARPAVATSTAPTLPPLPEALELSDYRLLNHLEDIEARRINFGVFEEWRDAHALASDLSMSVAAVSESLRRLRLHGLVLMTEEGFVRSRTAEMARLVRYAKQRFRKDDADDRPYLVRGLKLEIRNRDKPDYNVPLARAEAHARQAHGAGSDAAKAFELVGQMLRNAWSAPSANLAGFQSRALTSIFDAWTGGRDERFVIAADTGSGKTEAACLPIIAGATLDALRQIEGTRAVLVYPRVRLAANQAQRLARYLAALAGIEGAPVLTLGLQNAAVPENWRLAKEDAWERLNAAGQYRFPFFMCPQPQCGAPLKLTAGPAGRDVLNCMQCTWRFDGWIGTKEALRTSPPSLFLPTTESLHQWLNDRRYGALFGDGGAPPRCVLADEIHLYTHVQGAQIGYSLRRLLGRCALNGSAPLAVGMSATLGRPAHVWRELVGGPEPLLIEPDPSERTPNPKGREYFFFVQPEVESRNRDVAGASTTIQATMALAHNMHRRRGAEGGFRGIVFVDSIDKLKRLHGAYSDAEQNLQLASLRTMFYPDHPITGAPRRACCGDPLGCDLFRDGECWTFAATDARQATARGPYVPGSPLDVAPTPVFSGSSARIEEQIQRSDLVFSTASLEVGYDDPDMTFVYQHYAPSNLASFVQRKGRGGRGNDDRPVTGITLSVYSPRDSWFFRRPSALLDSRGFEVPLNLGNPIVARGQLVCLLLDVIARRERLGLPALGSGGRPHADAIAEFSGVCARVFAVDPFLRLDYADAERFVEDVVARFGPVVHEEYADSRRTRYAWAPRTLFGAASLPALEVVTPLRNQLPKTHTEDIAIGLSASAPGNATRRWDAWDVHWRTPRLGRSPFLDREELERAEAIPVEAASLRHDLPIDAREDLGDVALPSELLRPTRLNTSLIGFVTGGAWTPLIHHAASDNAFAPIPDNTHTQTQVDLRSTGSMRGFPVVTSARAGAPATANPAYPTIEKVETFVGDPQRGPGLHLRQVFWGADAEVRLVEQTDVVGVTQTFTDPSGKTAQLIGYEVETEGVQFTLPTDRIDAFISTECDRLAQDESELRWRRNQMLRYIVQRRARTAGINGYEARRAAELIVTAADNPSLAGELKNLLRMWSDKALAAVLKRTHSELLSCHPLLSERRIDRLVASLSGGAFRPLLESALKVRESEESLRMFLRSQLVHSIAIRLKHAFVLHGRGDERQVVAHVKLPIQFGKSSDDVITIAEIGIGGDGTTRTFAEHAGRALADFADGFAETCPNAAEDDLVDTAHLHVDRHDHWRSLDPRRSDTLDTIGKDLGIDFAGAAAPSPQQLMRLLYGSEPIAGVPFAIYDVWQDVMAARSDLAKTIGRDPDLWELVSAAVKGAKDGARQTLSSMLTAYGQIEGASLDGNLSPEDRLADQIYRVSGRLCFDGCLACLHGSSHLMPSTLADVAVSRRLLARFMASSRGGR